MKSKLLPLILLCLSGTAQAQLLDRGNGMLYDTDRNITWLNSATTPKYYMPWSAAMAWASNLVYGGFSDWRLPTLVDTTINLTTPCGNFGNNGQTCGYNSNTAESELAHLFYDELGLKAYYNTSGLPQAGWGLVNTGPFVNLQKYGYWTNVEAGNGAANGNGAWVFYFDMGGQMPADKDAPEAVIAVRDGDVVSAAVAPSITTSALANGVFGVAYSSAIVASAPNGDAVSVVVTGLPTGLSFDGANIIGTPTAVSNAAVNITVTDKVTGLSTSTTLTLTVNDAAIAFAPTLPDGLTGSVYSTTLAATGGTGSFTYTVNGVLPAGLTLVGDVLSGTPTQASTASINLTATDSAATATTAVVNITINDPIVADVPCAGTDALITSFTPGRGGANPILSRVQVNGGVQNGVGTVVWLTPTPVGTTFISPAVTVVTGEYIDYVGVVSGTVGCAATTMTVKPKVDVATTTLANAKVGAAYTASITAQYGLAPYTIKVSGMPAGLRFDGANLIGTPTVAGTFPLAITAADVNGVAVLKTINLQVANAPIVFAPTLSSGVVGKAYIASLSATGGANSSTFSATGLPSGLSLAGNVISGIPTVAGAATVTLAATDSAGVVSTVTATLTIAPAVVATKPIAPSNLISTAKTNSRVGFSWADNASNELNYLIERCKGANCTSFSQVASVGANVVSYSNTGLSRNTSYNYRVRATNANGKSAYSNTLSVKTLP
ncbi:MAG: DUF1566 domain-containing protein [Methylococcaceae bacterium]|nr:DUF1566 domain-containing protein [Methylococcaceae bacterium]